MTQRQESRAEQIIIKMIACAFEKSGKASVYRGRPSKDFPGEWRTLMRVTGLFKGEVVDEKK